MPDFYTVITDSGLQALSKATTQGQSFTITHAVIGDGNGDTIIPNKGMTSLVHEVWRGSVNGTKVDPNDPNTIIFEFAIPADVGGFTIREVGLLDADGTLFSIGNFPDTIKPLAEEGSVRDLIVRLPLHFENADAVNLVVDANVAIATRQNLLDHNADPNAHRLATETQTGFARFATDAEHVAHNQATAAATPFGVWKLLEAVKSDAVDLASSLRLATSQAVKGVMDALALHTSNGGMHIPVGQIYPVAFPPDELPEHHYVANGEGLLKTSEAGKTLLSMSTAYKTAHRVTENATHVFLPNVFDESGNGYFQRFVDGVNRLAGTTQSDAIRNITGYIDSVAHGYSRSSKAGGAFERRYSNDRGNATSTGGTEYFSFDASRVVPTADENRPMNYGFIPAIYLPPLGDA